MTGALGLAARGAWWRRRSSAAVAAAATVSVAAACAGPLWASAADDSTALARLEQLDRAELAVSARQPVTPGRLPDGLPALDPGAMGPPQPGSLRTAWDAVRLPEPVHGWYGDPEVLVTTQLAGLRRMEDDGRPAGGLLAGRTTLAWQHDQCELLDLTRGRCAHPWDGEATPEATVPYQLLQDLGMDVGDRLQVTTLLDEPERAGTTVPFPSVVEVVGAYRVPLADDTRWLDPRVFRYRAELREGNREVPPQLPAVLVPYELLDALRVTTVQTTVRRTIDVSDRRAADLSILRAALAERRATAERTPGASVPDVPAAAAVDALEPERQALRGVVLVVTAQLLLLSWYVLYLVVATTTAARSDEVALAKLRGRRVRSVVGLTLTEPLLLALLAVPTGVLLAWLVTDRAAHAVLRPGTPLFPDRTVAVAAAAALAGAVLAALIAARRTLVQPVHEQLRRSAPAGPGRAVVVVEVLVLALAAVGLWQLRSLGSDAQTSGISLLAPGLAAVAVALVSVRVLRSLARLWTRATRGRRGVVAFLTARQVARRPAAARTAALVTVSFAVTVFAVATWTVGQSHLERTARLEVGAPVVLTVEAAGTTALLEAVSAADPTGRRAMAAELRYPDESLRDPPPPLLAVDADRLAAVTRRPDGQRDPELVGLAEGLTHEGVPPLDVAGSVWEVDAASRVVEGPRRLLLQAQVRFADGRRGNLLLGEVPANPGTVRAEVPCEEGCRVTGLTLLRAPREVGSMAGTVVLGESRVDGRRLETGFDDPEAWRPGRVGELGSRDSVEPVVEEDDLALVFRLLPSQVPSIVRADVPAAAPAVLTAESRLTPSFGQPGTFRIPGLDGDDLVLQEERRAVVVPRLGREGVLVDLETADRLAGQPARSTIRQVWLAAPAPGLVAELQHRGVVVRGQESAADRATELRRTGPAIGMLTLLGVALAATLLTVAAVTAALASEARRRSYELAALRTVGVGGRTLKAAAVTEQVLLLWSGVVVGLVAGVVTARLALPLLPFSSLREGGPPLLLEPSWPTLGLLVFAVGGLLGLVGYVGGWWLARAAQPELLREAQA
ncbi:MAG TPA: FtsX-like permease family protein [Jiangellales bacterium]|nr:FtsX-like permease family protein [Jiangellales bacterium]